MATSLSPARVVGAPMSVALRVTLVRVLPLTDWTAVEAAVRLACMAVVRSEAGIPLPGLEYVPAPMLAGVRVTFPLVGVIVLTLVTPPACLIALVWRVPSALWETKR